MEDGKYMTMSIGKGPVLGIVAILVFGYVIVYFDMVIFGYVVACLALSVFFAIVGFDIGVPKRSAIDAKEDDAASPLEGGREDRVA